MNKKHDWDQAEQFFIEAGEMSGVSLQDISERFHIPYQSVRRYAAAHKWHSRRYRAWVKERHGMEYGEYIEGVYREAMSGD